MSNNQQKNVIKILNIKSEAEKEHYNTIVIFISTKYVKTKHMRSISLQFINYLKISR